MAAPKPPVDKQGAADKPKTVVLDVDAATQALIADRAATVESEIVALVQKRPDPPTVQQLLELQIDLRVIERELLSRAASDKMGAEQVNLLLRQMHLARTCTDLDDYLARTPVMLNGAEGTTLKNLHAKTYHLDQVDSGTQLDDLLDQTGLALLNIGAKIDAATVPLMRPQNASKPTTQKSPKDAPPLTLHDYAEAARSADVPPALHKQLATLAASAETPQPNDPDARLLAQTLVDSVTLLRGLGSLPIAPESRDHIQTMLTEGLTLMTDVRTRGAGTARLQSLSPFRDTMAHIGRLALPKDMSDALAPALAWAAQNTKDGPALLAAVSKFLEISGRYDALPHDSKMSPAMKTPHDDLEQAFANARATFATDAGGFSQPVVKSDVFASNPQQQIDIDIDELNRVVDSESLIYQIPAAVAAIESIKSHGNSIDHRATAAAVQLASTNKLLNTSESQRFLQDLARLGDIATSLKAFNMDKIPPALIESYAAGALTKFETRWRLLMGDQSNALVAGNALDKTKLAKLDTAVDLINALMQAPAIQSTIANAPVLARWADWTLTGKEIDDLVDPYRTATSTAFVAFSTDDQASIDLWMHMRKRYKPLLDLLNDAASRADACNVFPAGLQGDAATLMTPISGQPFAGVRRASVEIAVWARLMGQDDSDSADVVLEDLSKGVRRRE